MLIKPPIVINDSPRIDASGDLRVYVSIERAESSIEWNDAHDDQLHVFDSDGLLLKVVANEDGRGAHLEASEARPSHRGTLLVVLRDFLLRLGEPAATIEAMTLEDVIAAAYDRSPNPYSG